MADAPIERASYSATGERVTWEGAANSTFRTKKGYIASSRPTTGTMEGVGANRYAYAQNDPINRSDPNGHRDASDKASYGPGSRGFSSGGSGNASNGGQGNWGSNSSGGFLGGVRDFFGGLFGGGKGHRHSFDTGYTRGRPELGMPSVIGWVVPGTPANRKWSDERLNEIRTFGNWVRGALGLANEKADKDTTSKPPAGSRPIDQTKWSGNHQEIKKGIGAGPQDKTSISPDGDVWGQNTDGSWTNHGQAADYTGSGGARGWRGRDREEW